MTSYWHSHCLYVCFIRIIIVDEVVERNQKIDCQCIWCKPKYFVSGMTFSTSLSKNDQLYLCLSTAILWFIKSLVFVCVCLEWGFRLIRCMSYVRCSQGTCAFAYNKLSGCFSLVSSSFRCSRITKKSTWLICCHQNFIQDNKKRFTLVTILIAPRTTKSATWAEKSGERKMYDAETRTTTHKQHEFRSKVFTR